MDGNVSGADYGNMGQIQMEVEAEVSRDNGNKSGRFSRLYVAGPPFQTSMELATLCGQAGDPNTWRLAEL